VKSLTRIALLLGLLGALGTAPGPAQDGVANPGAGHVVLVELFTSQGCSSCPPADRLLSRIAEERAGSVVTLSYHVDFWNSAGWTDPFSTKEWTQRQVAYGRRFKAEQIYTPQAVVDGAVEVVGSRAEGLRSAIDAAASRPGGEIALALEPSASRVEVTAEVRLPEALRGEHLDLMVALYETGLVTSVGRGENGGRTLHNDYVVRRLERAGRLAANGPAETRHSASLRLSKDWNRSRLGVATFLQEPKTLEIRGAAARAFPAGAR
jgi:hypothetical protein